MSESDDLFFRICKKQGSAVSVMSYKSDPWFIGDKSVNALYIMGSGDADTAVSLCDPADEGIVIL